MNILALRTAKTGIAVRIPLPPSVLQALKEIKTGMNIISGRVTERQNHAPVVISGRLNAYMKLPKWRMAMRIGGGTHSRWNYFCPGCPWSRFQFLLGHQSVRVTERHYSPWVKVRQEAVRSRC
jgi:hypothetical protein